MIMDHFVYWQICQNGELKLIAIIAQEKNLF